MVDKYRTDYSDVVNGDKIEEVDECVYTYSPTSQTRVQCSGPEIRRRLVMANWFKNRISRGTALKVRLHAAGLSIFHSKTYGSESLAIYRQRGTRKGWTYFRCGVTWLPVTGECCGFHVLTEKQTDGCFSRSVVRICFS